MIFPRIEKAILWCLHREPGMRGPEICEITGIWRISIYGYLAQIEDRGLVRHEVEPHPEYPLEVHRYYAAELPKASA